MRGPAHGDSLWLGGRSNIENLLILTQGTVVNFTLPEPRLNQNKNYIDPQDISRLSARMYRNITETYSARPYDAN